MDDSKSKIIKEIAQNLNCGLDSYFNSKTDEIISIPNFSQIADEEEFQEAFKADLQKISKNESDYIKIEVLESFESFKIMERFVNQMPENQLKSDLEKTLQNKKPFQNFKYSIENSDFRKLWFEFKQNELEKIVTDELDL
ncbi:MULTISPECIES: UPF0158 family protein [Bizionia]|uniref:Uncharacterized protein n=1 Tax=Bizionia algoritergicola TaxID=291187 RepID=A0A5D0QJQ7_9FLAO|nr:MULTISPECIES: UPF0158 family protein [Bizionia]OBX17898.1 hypothetical protein BAA08_15725 [Bizionia sp. APA-3]TYB69522.1 hypothetical protein ES675_16040 [Bizionia algoritergicola]